MEILKKNKALLLVIFSVIFYTIFLMLSDINKISIELNQIKWEYFLIIFPLTFLTIIITGLRYHLILRELKIKCGVKNSLEIFIAGLSMLITPGGSGALIKSYILKKQIGISISSTGPIIIFEKWIEFVSIILIIGFLLLQADYVESKLVFFIGIGLSVFSFIVLRNSHGLEFLNKILNRIPFTKKFVIDVEEFRKTASRLFHPVKFLKFLGITMITKIIPLFVVYLIFESINSPLNLFSSGQIYFTSTLIGVLTLIPGGVIVTEGGMLGMLLSNGVELEKSYVIVMFVRFVTFWFPVILGFVTLKKILSKIS